MKKWLETDSFEEAFDKFNDNADEIEQGFYNRYTKQEVDDELNTKADKSDTYTKTEVDISLGLKANKQQEAWITPTLLNGWENVASTTPIGYYKDTLGVVHFRGALKGGVDNTEAFVLPVGYRPSTTIRSVGMTSDNTVGRYDINPAGLVRPHKGSGTYIYAVNTSFRAG